ncbi:LysR family transcriptional regulator [Novosphingobium sp. TH158]|uniref:LysR family transcriptional regulator n=1 Tax=Novosphingobium sp. TH158 TaxID=2067455 RepID=UPI000C7CC933|nr:LysR family transcriptional regulator [Novosphingobium sp. TH158]PLK26935.1 hypothetical protein C0V78_08575 [Novosphingobium sp. TH158]
MNIDLARLRHILAVERTRSFSRAAQECHITQPALSRSIAAFEVQHGVRLFERSRGGVVPTAAGRLVAEQAQAMLAAANDLERDLRLYGRGEAGRVSFGIGPLLAALLLPQISRNLLNASPRLALKAVVRPGDLISELLADNLELVFANAWHLGDQAELVIEPVGAFRLALLARAGHPLAGREGLLLADLAPYPSAAAVDASAAVAGAGAGLVCDNYHVLHETVLGTDCIMLSCPALVAQDIAAGRIVVLDVADQVARRSEIVMARRRGRKLSPAAEALAQTLREKLAELPDQP